MNVIGVELRKDDLVVQTVSSSLFGCRAKGCELIRGATLREMLDGLKRYISSNSIKEPVIALALPRSAAISGVLQVPAPDASAIGRILVFEIAKHIPFKPEDAYWGFEVTGRKENIFSVFFSAARKNTVDRILSEFRDAGLEPVLATAWQACVLNASGSGKNAQSLSAVIGIDGADLTFDLFSGGVPVYSGRINPTRINKAGLANAAASELDIALRQAGTSPDGRRLERCFVASESVGKGMLDELAGGLGLPVKSIGADQGGQKAYPAALGAALGVAGKGRLNVNLLPSAVPGKAAYGLGRTVALAASLAGLLLLTGAAYIVKDILTIKKLESSVAEAKLQKDRIDGFADSHKSADERIRVIEEMRPGAPGALDILKDLTVTLPSGTWLTEFAYSSGVVFIEGYSDGASALLLELEHSGAVKDAEFAGPVTKGQGGKEHFRIKLRARERV